MSDERGIHKCHPELVSGSHSEPFLEHHRGQMLNQVQHDEMKISMRRGNVGTLRAASEVFTHANHANPTKGLEQYFVRFVKV